MRADYKLMATAGRFFMDRIICNQLYAVAFWCTIGWIDCFFPARGRREAHLVGTFHRLCFAFGLIPWDGTILGLRLDVVPIGRSVAHNKRRALIAGFDAVCLVSIEDFASIVMATLMRGAMTLDFRWPGAIWRIGWGQFSRVQNSCKLR